MPDPPRHPRRLRAEAEAAAAARARKEAANGLKQFALVEELVRGALNERRFRLTALILERLNEAAMEGIDPRAGVLRTGHLYITNSEHVPPDGQAMLDALDAACSYVEEHWRSATAIHLGAFVMWRLGWIHPFWDGNGRTSRAAGYLVMAVRLGFLPPGSVTIPEMLSRNRRSYFEALEDADAACRGGRIQVDMLQRLLDRYLRNQLDGAIRDQ